MSVFTGSNSVATNASTSPFTGRFTPIAILVALVITISLLTRTVLLFHPNTHFSWTLGNIAGVFGIGLFYDLSVCGYIILPFVLHLWLTNDGMYSKKGEWFTHLAFALFMAILLFTKIIPPDFNKGLYKALKIYIALRWAIYTFLTFQTAAFRNKWRAGVLYAVFMVVTFLLLFNGISEGFFWSEFSTRYNFIAVDYLVYTNEVVGNIRESYPVNWIVAGVLLVTVAIFFTYRKTLQASVAAPSRFGKRTAGALAMLLISGMLHLWVNGEGRKFSKNEYANELAGNGIYCFGNAFWNNELDFYQFYKTLPDKEAFALVRKDLDVPYSHFISADPFNLDRQISYPQPEAKHNVVLISVESFSADFMQHFGSQQNITPYLDSLADKSLLFTNLYASGTRTVRGLEALSLAIPPTPGQSIVKRPHNENLFSLGSVFRSKGYTTQYIYGGYGYFDNMNYFFGHNDYEVIDRSALKPEQIHYENVWGVADEDLFTLALNTMDSNAALGKPFFSHVMTVSNHRPFTYPDGRIDIPSTSQSREGGVKYTDYAINKFLKEAAAKPWFNNTIFVIVADHCAGSAGSVQLPVTGYHIPMMVYAPALLKPHREERLTAQIDIAPTILGLLHFRYQSKFLGQDILNLPAGKEKAFISTYQGLGFIQNGQLVLQSPVRKVKSFIPDFKTGDAREAQVPDSLVKKAMAYYQVAAWEVKHKRYGKINKS
ncbi:Phosphoglycerol transferase MdoB [Cnuella takakiae]|uniref:Phosphoglycerol transferase MdoB n=1 Tax=Cnuella takakiae TaxID=1302690 RepID=A0A1M5I7C2_9BACT|nr:LTA synthase family protein [Cnuella takakiae]OLY93202.1 sulfatase [Cnuella takakiae]SHG24161.1 Phosphoglycerol transferase MdoB [Cnuella takakiae]